MEKEHDKHFRFTMTTNGMRHRPTSVIDLVQPGDVTTWCCLWTAARRSTTGSAWTMASGNGSYDRIVPKFQKLVKARGGQGYYMRGTFTASQR